MFLGGVSHFAFPEIYYPFIPDFLPKPAVNIAAAVLEIVMGLGLFVEKLKKISALFILIALISFLPIHVFDMLKENPAIGSKTLAYIRLPLQFLLIYWAYLVYQHNKLNTKNQND
jgi:uncharacterized membrane protein